MSDPQLQREWDRMDAGFKQWSAGQKKARIYVSGPMSGMPDFNFPAFDHAALRLRKEGWKVVNPADKGIVEGWEWEDYLRHDVKEVCDCDAIYMLEGWDESAGACLELAVAEGLGLEVLYE
jgi:hypothetical protein